MIKRLKIKSGFTLIEMIVTVAIIALLSSVVFANYRGGQRSQELSIALQQVVNDIEYTRTLTLGGQVDEDGNFPPLGHEVRFYKMPANDNKYQIVRQYEDSDSLIKENSLHNCQFINFVHCTEQTLPADPQDANWQPVGDNNLLRIRFKKPGVIEILDDSGNIVETEHAGGVIEHNGTGKRMYFYVTLDTGLISYGERN